MNYRLWEAARDGNEPLVEKALKAGANVNSFFRSPDQWMNITVGEIAGADEYTTGLNVHWMELNNYTALHLAAASGNAAIIDKVWCHRCRRMRPCARPSRRLAEAGPFPSTRTAV